jgi:riboflavin-specific deaminase-like protein
MKPHTLLNVATSIDGKITTGARDFHKFGGDEDRDFMETLRASADAVIVGAGTLRDEDPLLTIRSPEKIKKRQRENRPAQPRSVIVSRSLDFPIENSRFFACRETEKIVCTGDDAPKARVKTVGRYAEIIKVRTTGSSGIDLVAAMSRLSEFGVKRLLLEGGGTLNFAMIAAGLVDEIHVTLCPIVIGGDDAPSAFGGAGFSAGSVRGLRLHSLREGKGGRVFLHYLA